MFLNMQKDTRMVLKLKSITEFPNRDDTQLRFLMFVIFLKGAENQWIMPLNILVHHFGPWVKDAPRSGIHFSMHVVADIRTLGHISMSASTSAVSAMVKDSPVYDEGASSQTLRLTRGSDPGMEEIPPGFHCGIPY